MCIKKLAAVVFSVSVLASLLTSCGGKATLGSATTKAQAASANRGVKLEKEECEEMVLERGAPPRDFGVGVADDESFALNLALLDARSKLAQQMQTLSNGVITKFNEKYKNKDGSSSTGREKMLQQNFFEELLAGTRPVCKNSYVKENGDYNVYVAIELDEKMMSKIKEAISKEAELEIKEHEEETRAELETGLEEMRRRQRGGR
jgi:hypothetical protein